MQLGQDEPAKYAELRKADRLRKAAKREKTQEALRFARALAKASRSVPPAPCPATRWPQRLRQTETRRSEFAGARRGTTAWPRPWGRRHGGGGNPRVEGAAGSARQEVDGLPEAPE